jgi:glucose-1-phosphate adenylyltransferase
MAVDGGSRVVAFDEKPDHPRAMPDTPGMALVSMGIYVFGKDLLIEQLRSDSPREASTHDFGKDLIPRLISTHKVHAYAFGGIRGRVTPDRYWRDVGTLDAYYDANMDLLKPAPPLDLYQRDWSIRTYHGQNPPARMVAGAQGTEGLLANSILGAGTVIAGGTVRHSILSSRVHIHEGAVVEDAILFDNVTVGSGARLRRCIVDKEVVIPPGETLGFDLARDAARFTLSDNGIVVVPENYRFE